VGIAAIKEAESPMPARKKSAQSAAGNKSSAKKSSLTKSSAKNGPARKSSVKASSAKKKIGARKYSPAASEFVREEMEEFKEGKLRSGRSGKKVTDPKQAVAIALSEARREGKKVPPNPNHVASKKKS
jgi:hypothetical protein